MVLSLSFQILFLWTHNVYFVTIIPIPPKKASKITKINSETKSRLVLTVPQVLIYIIYTQIYVHSTSTFKI